MAKITGEMLVAKFRSFEHVPYVWGGASTNLGWDCSGACNNIIGWQFHLAIPNHNPGGFNPFFEHGPVVADWIQWIGVLRHPFSQFEPAPGDLIAWGPNVHMGMALSATRFVSAANPTDGTIEADIGSFFNYDPYVLRLLEIVAGATIGSIPKPPGPGRDDYSPTIRTTAQYLTDAGTKLQDGYKAILDLR